MVGLSQSYFIRKGQTKDRFGFRDIGRTVFPIVNHFLTEVSREGFPHASSFLIRYASVKAIFHVCFPVENESSIHALWDLAEATLRSDSEYYPTLVPAMKGKPNGRAIMAKCLELDPKGAWFSKNAVRSAPNMLALRLTNFSICFYTPSTHPQPQPSVYKLPMS